MCDVLVFVLIFGVFDIYFGGDYDVMILYVCLLIVCVMIVLMIVFMLFILYLWMGCVCCVCVEDMKMVNLFGIDMNCVILFMFVFGVMLVVVGGVLIGLMIGKLNLYIGFVVGIKVFIVVVFGGIGSILGVMFGGVLLGFVEIFVVGYMLVEYKDVVVFGLFVLILFFCLIGLFGKLDIEKV